MNLFHLRVNFSVLVLLVLLAGCGRSTSGASPADLVSSPPRSAPATTTTEVPATVVETTTTTAAPVTPETTVTTRAKPATTTTTATTEPVRQTTTTTTVVAPPPPPEPPVTHTPTVLSHGGPVRDHVSLVDNLRARGLIVVPVDSVRQPFLRGDGTVLEISGAGIARTQLQSYQYESAEAAAADAATFRPDGNPRLTSVAWRGTPHLYVKGRVLVIYVGSDPGVTGLLTDLLGPQFAGG